jgi:hypothetical protein
MTHDQLKAKVIEALDELFYDTSVSKEETAASLKGIREMIDTLIESL